MVKTQINVNRTSDSFLEATLPSGEFVFLSITKNEFAVFKIWLFHIPTKKLWGMNIHELTKKLSSKPGDYMMLKIIRKLEGRGCRNIAEVEQILNNCFR